MQFTNACAKMRPVDQQSTTQEGNFLMKSAKYNRVLLAYSGGLDTSIIIPWLKENYGCQVICCAADVGQGEELEPLHEKAKKTGAEKLYIEDLKKEFVEDFIQISYYAFVKPPYFYRHFTIADYPEEMIKLFYLIQIF